MSSNLCPIVVIGSSAASLKALKALFSDMHTAIGAAFFLFQDLDPKYDSLITKILSKSASMPTLQVVDGLTIQPNHVYVIPPNTCLTLNQYSLKLSESFLQQGLQMSIDTFLLSLSKQHKHSAIIITGSRSYRSTSVPIPLKDDGSEQNHIIQALEDELHRTHADLQSKIKELESSNLALELANQEVMSVNQEFQLSIEEFESSKEELQSINEELITVNSQYKDKVVQLALSNDDLANFLSSKDIATLVVDATFKIKHFTEATCGLLSLISTDIGRPLTDIRPKFNDPALLDDAYKVMSQLLPIEKEIFTDDGDCYLRRILPYRTRHNKIDGVVINFIDITARRRADDQIRRLAAIVRDSNDAVTVMDLHGKITAWNKGATKMYGWSEQEALLMYIYVLIPTSLHKDVTLMLQQIANGNDVFSMETTRITKDKCKIDVWLTVTPLQDKDGHIVAAAIIERDITKRNQLQANLLASEANFRALVESAPDAMLIVNSEGAVELANTQAERLFGYNKGALIGITIEQLMPDRSRHKHKTLRQQFFGKPRVRIMGAGQELFAQTIKGDEFPVEVSLSPIETDSGRVVSASIRDVSERIIIEKSLRDALKRADSALATKARFLATASHDLRQPLHALKLLNRALLSRTTDPSSQKMLNIQNESLSGMAHLLNSLLNISKLDSGNVGAKMSHFEVKPVLQRMQAEFELEAVNKGIDLRLKVTGDIVISDPDLLAQLLQNLMANAIRYTHTGFIDLSCVTQHEQVLIAVQDSGVGIPEKEIAHIFDEFHQVNRDPQERHGGLGLGLSIVQRIAMLLGIQVSVSSAIGQGSCFSFVLPQGQLNTTELTQAKLIAPLTTVANSHILLIDDDAYVLEATQMLLSTQNGFNIKTATSPPEAYESLNQVIPDLIITDFHLNHAETGIDIIRTIRKNTGEMIPVILISGDTSASMEPLTNEENFIEVLVKPTNGEELINTAQKLLSKKNQK
jgi:PAS domain S-box-containing protein